MVGPRGGTWVPFRPGLRLDPCIVAGVAALAEKLGHLVENEAAAHAIAQQAIICSFLDLSVWALSNGFDDGRVDTLSDTQFGMTAVPCLVESGLCTPREIGALVRTSMLEARMLEQDGSIQRIADFARDNSKLLTDRARNRANRRKNRKKYGKEITSSDGPWTGRGQSSERTALQEQEQEQEEEEEEEEEQDLSLSDGESDLSDEDPLVQHVIQVSRWHGKRETVVQALSDLKASGLSVGEIRSRFDELGTAVIGFRPYDTKNEILRMGGAASSGSSLPAAPAYESADDWERRQAEDHNMTVEEYQRFRNENFYPNRESPGD